MLDKVSAAVRPKLAAERWLQGLSTLAEGSAAAVQEATSRARGARARALTKNQPSLVFVHGLNSHHERSWTATNTVHWPRDLLPAGLPLARILAWGYDARTHRQTSSEPTVYP